MVITLKIEDNDGETFEYNIFPCELTRELVEKHLDQMIDDFPQLLTAQAISENTVDFILKNFKMGSKVIFNDELDENEQLKIFTHPADIVASFVLGHTGDKSL